MSEENTNDMPVTPSNKLEQEMHEAALKEAAVQNEVSVNTEEVSEIHKKAIEMGWNPDHDGPNFVPAEEYVRRAPLFRRIEDQTKQIRELRELVKQSTKHMSDIRKDAYNKAIKDLEDSRNQSVEMGDVQKFQVTEAQVKNLRTQMQNDPIINTPPIENPVDPQVQAFGERNQSWYNDANSENKKMKAAAEAVDTFLMKQAAIDGKEIVVKDHLKAIEAEVQRLFPHRFEAQKKTATAVGKSTSSSGESKGTSLASKLSPQQRQLGEQMKRLTPGFTLEEYAKQLKEMGRLGS